LGNSRAGGGVNGIGAREGFQGPELIERADDLFWISQNGDRVRLEAGAGGVAGFDLSWPSKMRAGKGSFLGGRLKLALKKISAGRRPGMLGRANVGQTVHTCCLLRRFILCRLTLARY